MSDELSQDKEIIKLEKKLVRNFQTDFVTDVRKMDKQELDRKLLDLAKYSQAIKSTMKIDDKLIDAKNTVSSLKRPYNEDIRGNNEKARFVALVMEEEFGEIK